MLKFSPFDILCCNFSLLVGSMYRVSYVKWTGLKIKMEFYTSDSVVNSLETN